MNDVENQVQKYLVNFCKILPTHVCCWRLLLQESVKPIQTLINLSEQQHHVKRMKISNFEDFVNAKDTLLFEISRLVEEDVATLKEIVDKINKANADLKNKLSIFERSTLNLDWDKITPLIRGNGSQPSLARLLESSLYFMNFFLKSGRNINDCFKALNLNDKKTVKSLQNSFNVNVDDEIVTSLITLTQYVDNEKAIL